MTASQAEPPALGAVPTPLLDIMLPADAASVPAARRAVRLKLAGEHDGRLDTILLLVTELLSNAVNNGDGAGPAPRRRRCWAGAGGRDGLAPRGA